MNAGLQQIEQAVAAVFAGRRLPPPPRPVPAPAPLGSGAVAALLRRLGAARQGGRELDCAVHLAVTGADATLDDALERADYIGVPRYTTSLDAALTLVADGGYAIATEGGAALARIGGAREVRHRSAALALCMAALAARLA
jgi:hypothetical protein